MDSRQNEGDKTRSSVLLPSGTPIGHYRIIEEIGAGGMGEVYLAEDTNLSRQVAIKVLLDLFGGDAERLARFEREAKLLASLNAPNLATIYGLENVQGKQLLVMELVEGETLAKRIAKGPLPLDEALDIFQQIAAGMEAAHEKGIIHRDLKPANIKITPEGKVKILDFGLAKDLHGESIVTDAAASPTITADMTRAGVILGTAAYMSPEQAKGKRVDKRADIWAFGCIVYECLAGKRAFEGETTSDTLAAILRGKPDWNQLPRETPPYIKSLLCRCLQKDASYRLRDIGDAMLYAQDHEALSSEIPEERGRLWRAVIPWAVAALLLVVSAYLWYSSRGKEQVNQEPVISSILPPENSVSCFRDGFALSTDGRKIAFVSLSSKGERLVWVRHLDRQEAEPLSGTDDASYPFWSPDSKQIAFYAGGKLKRISAEGGAVQTLCAANIIGNVAWGSWGSAGIILFGNTWGGISSVSEGGGESNILLLKEAYAPFFLPDGRRFLYADWTGAKPSIRLAALDQPGHGKEILGTADMVRVQWVQPDRLVLWRYSDQSLVTQRVDLNSGCTFGPQELLAAGIESPGDWPMVCTSPAGTMAFVVNPTEAGSDISGRLLWVDRMGKEGGYLGDIAGYWNLRISPDGRSVVTNMDEDAWTVDVATGMITRLTNEKAANSAAYRPIWSAKGDFVLARGWENVENVVKVYPVSGGQAREIFRDSSSIPNFTDWSRDGRYLAVMVNGRQTKMSDLAYFDLTDNQLKPFLASPADERAAQFSPDGLWIAYESNETGTYEVYIRSFPAGDQSRRVSYTGGRHPRWRGDGKELFFLAPGWTVMAADIELQPTPQVGTPKPLFQMVMADIVKGSISPYDVSPDGQRFLIIQPQTKPVPLTLVQNWQALVDR